MDGDIPWPSDAIEEGDRRRGENSGYGTHELREGAAFLSGIRSGLRGTDPTASGSIPWYSVICSNLAPCGYHPFGTPLRWTLEQWYSLGRVIIFRREKFASRLMNGSKLRRPGTRCQDLARISRRA